ncbi:MAG TPA: DHH family phosphoesterase [Candidatus Faecalibacterium avium]|nr:signaling protein consisting of a modified GGDEF domain and a DHH domain protein [Faecalibacterium sp. An121]HIV44002.1 DHH family phosphoesterase [Candidatus Faecalibacterium avium]
MFTMGFALLAAALSLLLLVVQPALGPVVLVVAVVCIILVVVSRYRIRRWAARWVTGTSFENSRTQYSLASLSQPAALLSGDTVVWYNLPFRDRVLAGGDQLAGRVNKMLPGLDMAQCAGPDGQVLACVSGTWRIHASTVKGEGEKVSILILNDETALRRVELEYKASRPGYMIFSVDGYDDVFSDMLDSESARLLERINRTIEAMIARGTGFLRRVANGRYIAVVEERQLEQFAQQGYDVLDKIRALEPSINLSISIGIGRRAPTLHEAQEMAVQALDMAQGRGGDQAAEMTPDGFTFYGGVSHGVEKRSKVRSRIVAEALVGLIKAADHVVIMGHRMSDLDAIGSAEGMLRICKICDVPAVIAVKREATLASSLINAIEDAGQEGDFIDPRSALSIISKETLCIVVDTYQVGQVECKEILEKCGKIAVIDHHRKGVGYIENAVLVCHEPYASSASELVTELLQYVGTRDDKPTRIEAEGLLAGIMLDTRNFSLHTGVRTFEAAAALRRYGAETERAWALFDVSLPEYNAKASLVAKAQMYKGCAVVLSGELPAEAQVAVPQAANDLLSIEGVQASFVAVQAGSMVKISARSMGQVNVQVIMESMGGGGHQTMAATVLKHTTMEQAHAHLCAAIDAYRAAQKKGSVKA